MLHQMRLWRYICFVAIAWSQTDLVEGELHDVVILASGLTLAQILQVNSAVVPLPWHRKPVKIIDVRPVSLFHSGGRSRAVQLLAILVDRTLLVGGVEQHNLPSAFLCCAFQPVPARVFVEQVCPIRNRLSTGGDAEVEAKE